ncbi:MAG: ADP-ribosylglycohydrolase family protein [Candidatus Bipolaricaulis sp.]|nr:ADP-ribosylglycohydrolase family protein [Candidatus Bipolaricaulis sp.]MDD5645993.1 ADP-ribosylglycohydrolase family protein [Candidatus Bipolaricaulis sp.]
MALPANYEERVYAGVLGKMIGVYLGRPLEIVGDRSGGKGWTYEEIVQTLGDVCHYVHEELGLALVAADDDITGTLTFLRAISDNEAGASVTPQQIGDTWLNYLIEGHTVLWWTGMGISTEHTAYLRLASGIPAPQSGSARINGSIAAQQIGGQIFVDGWAMVAAGDPELAASLAQRAASVSHDGEAVFAAQVLAAMEAQAFVEPNIDALLDVGLRLIPATCEVRRLIDDLRDWRETTPDWRIARQRLAREYGYDRFRGNCPVIPNHGVIILGLLYGEGSFHKTLSIVNTCGWDTDCNSGNAGCLMGIRNGLEGIDHGGPDWRGPVADRLYLPTADGGGAITDAARESYRIAGIGRALAGEPVARPKDGARFHFEFPGAVQGFLPEEVPEKQNVVAVRNVEGHSRWGRFSLAVDYHLVAGGCAHVATPTFVTPEARAAESYYELVASPTLYSGEPIRAELSADPANPAPVTCRMYTRTYNRQDELERQRSAAVILRPGEAQVLQWTAPDTEGYPITEIGIELESVVRSDGTVYLDRLSWEDVPTARLCPETPEGTLWPRAWVDATDHPREAWWPPVLRLVQNRGIGLMIQGTRDWMDYSFSARLCSPLTRSTGVAVRVNGLRRYYALLLCADQTVRLVKRMDGEQRILASTELAWESGETYTLELEVHGTADLIGRVGGGPTLTAVDHDRRLGAGAVAVVCEEGTVDATEILIRSAAER